MSEEEIEDMDEGIDLDLDEDGEGFEEPDSELDEDFEESADEEEDGRAEVLANWNGMGYGDVCNACKAHRMC